MQPKPEPIIAPAPVADHEHRRLLMNDINTHSQQTAEFRRALAAVRSHNRRHHRLKHMKPFTKWGCIFCHVNNVVYIYRNGGVPLPGWFTEAYAKQIPAEWTADEWSWNNGYLDYHFPLANYTLK